MKLTPGPFWRNSPVIQWGIEPRTWPSIGIDTSLMHDLNQMARSTLGYIPPCLDSHGKTPRWAGSWITLRASSKRWLEISTFSPIFTNWTFALSLDTENHKQVMFYFFCSLVNSQNGNVSSVKHSQSFYNERWQHTTETLKHDIVLDSLEEL